jgi:hypothetical protein
LIKSIHNNLGFQLLEHAVASLVVLLITVGVYDLSRIFQVKSALNHSIQATLRCLYPSDGACVSHSDPNSTPLYRVAYKAKTDLRFEEAIYDYSGEASWLGLPKLIFSNPTAKVLDEVTYQVPQKAYRVEQAVPIRIGRYKYILQTTRSPYALTTQGAKEPSFVYKANHNIDYPLARLRAQNPISLSSIAGTTKSSKGIGSVNFVLARLSDNACYQSRQMDIVGPNKAHQPAFSRKCEEQYADIVIHVRGKVPLRNSSIGQMLFNISQDGVINRELGGLKFWQTAGQSGNLVPRGLPDNYYSDSHGYSEFWIHSPIRIKRSQEVKLSFRINKLSGSSSDSVAWSGVDLKIYAADYSSAITFDAVCKNSNMSEACEAESPDTGVTIPEDSLTSSYLEQTTAVKELGCLSTLEQANGLAGGDRCFNCRVIESNNQSCPFISVTKKCPANWGISTFDFENLKLEAAKICPIETNAIYNSANWKEVQINLGNYKIERQTKNCSDFSSVQSYEIPELLKPYKKLNWSGPQVVSYQPFYTGDVAPSNYREINKQYNCAQVLIQSRSFDSYNQSNPSSELEDSLFANTYLASQLSCDWESDLKTEAIKYGLDPASYFVASRVAVGSRPSTNILSACLQAPVSFINSNTPDQHQDNLTLEQAQRLCDFLTSRGLECHYRPSFIQDSLQPVKSIDRLMASRDYGFKALHSQVPRAAYQCSSENCANFEILDLGSHIKVGADFRLKLASLLGRSFLISAAADRAWE